MNSKTIEMKSDLTASDSYSQHLQASFLTSLDVLRTFLANLIA